MYIKTVVLDCKKKSAMGDLIGFEVELDSSIFFSFQLD